MEITELLFLYKIGCGFSLLAAVFFAITTIMAILIVANYERLISDKILYRYIGYNIICFIVFVLSAFITATMPSQKEVFYYMTYSEYNKNKNINVDKIKPIIDYIEEKTKNDN